MFLRTQTSGRRLVPSILHVVSNSTIDNIIVTPNATAAGSMVVAPNSAGMALLRRRSITTSLQCVMPKIYSQSRICHCKHTTDDKVTVHPKILNIGKLKP